MEQQLINNMLLKYKSEENKVERILWSDKSSNTVVTINIFDNEWPQFIDLDNIINLIKDGEIEILEKDPVMRIIKEEDVGEKDRLIREKAWDIVSMLNVGVERLKKRQDI